MCIRDRVWTFSPADRTARFWYRRRAQETGLHRVDAELAAGQAPPPAEPELAVDGGDDEIRARIERYVANGVTTTAPAILATRERVQFALRALAPV